MLNYFLLLSLESIMTKIRLATLDDVDVLKNLIQASVRGLSREEYSPDEIDGGLQDIFGVDTQLIQDETYYVIEDEQDTIVACGGWSKRKTLYGGNQFIDREDELLTPTTDPAKIRAFFVHPDHARRGYGRLLLNYCEEQALNQGFSSFEMMATLPGVKLYTKCGYLKDSETYRHLSNGCTLGFFKMKKNTMAGENQPAHELGLKYGTSEH